MFPYQIRQLTKNKKNIKSKDLQIFLHLNNKIATEKIAIYFQVNRHVHISKVKLS